MPRTRVDARAVSPPARRKLRRLSCMAHILAVRDQREKWRDLNLLFAENTGAVAYWTIRRASAMESMRGLQ